jgi:teichuronic acid exporter
MKWTSIGAIVNAVAKYGQTVYLVRILKKEDFGIMAIALLFISFLEIFMDMGFSSAILHRNNISKKEYSSLYWFNIFLGLFFFIILYICAPHIAVYYKNEQLSNIISLLSLMVFFSSISGLQRTFQQKNMRFKLISLIEMISSILMVVLSIILVNLDFAVYSLVFSSLFRALLIAGIYLIYAIFWEKNIMFHFHFFEIKPFLKIGIYRVGSSVFNYFSTEMDIMLISSIYSLEILGAYSLCKQLTQKIISFINPVITKVLTPTLARLQSSKTSLKHKFVQTIRILSMMNFPLFFLLAYSSSYVLGILYGNTYAEYSLILSLLAINSLINSITNPLGSLLSALGKTNIEFYWTIYRIIITFIVLKIGALFNNIYILVLSVLLITLFNLIPEIKFIYKKLISLGFKEYIRIIKHPLLFCIVLSPLCIFQWVIRDKYIGICMITILFIFMYLFLYLLLDKKTIIEIGGCLKLDRFYIYNLIIKNKIIRTEDKYDRI